MKLPRFDGHLTLWSKEFEMGKTRPPYPAEFRGQMVELVRAGRTPAELAREFDVTAQTIANWVGAAGGQSSRSQATTGALSGAEREELARLRRQLRQVQMERDILAKATAWFAAKSDKTFTPSSNS
jgi:transposase